MNIWKISIKNLKSKPLYTLLSIFVLSLSIALLLGVKQLNTSFKNQIDSNLGSIDLVLGAKGSPLQLILSSVLHLDNPTGNISYQEAKKIGKNPLIKSAIPISYGDNYKGYRIVGSTKQFLSLYKAELQNGHSVEKSMEVILGNTVANELNLKVGNTFFSAHGLTDNDIEIHTDAFKVVGILKPTQKVIDRLIITNLESIWDVHDHDEHDHEKKEHSDVDEEHNHDEHDHEEKEHSDVDGEHNHYEHNHEEKEHSDVDGEHNHYEHNHEEKEHSDVNEEHNHDEHNHEEKEHIDVDDVHDHEEHNHEEHEEENKEITSLLIKFKSPRALLTYPRRINKETNMQAALPKYELNKLYEFTSVGFTTISWIAYIILVISSVIIFISLYKMVKERAFDLAILRTYGASNLQLIKMVFYEGVILVFSALLFGFLLLKITLYTILNFVESSYQQNILQELSFYSILQIVIVIFVTVILSVSLAVYPIIKMNISTILSNEK